MPRLRRLRHWPARLFAIDGVSNVFLGPDFISVTKADNVEWPHMKPAILGAVMGALSVGSAGDGWSRRRIRAGARFA